MQEMSIGLDFEAKQKAW